MSAPIFLLSPPSFLFYLPRQAPPPHGRRLAAIASMPPPTADCRRARGDPAGARVSLAVTSVYATASPRSGMSGPRSLRGCRPGPAAVAGRSAVAVPGLLLFGIDAGGLQFALLFLFNFIFTISALIHDYEA